MIEHDRTLNKQRNRIERMFGHLKINRAIATRYDQLANSFLGMVHLATARYWLEFVHAAKIRGDVGRANPQVWRRSRRYSFPASSYDHCR